MTTTQAIPSAASWGVLFAVLLAVALGAFA
jgi:hypothetical protein